MQVLKLSQGGQVGYEYLIIVALIAGLGALYVSKKEARKPQEQILELQKENESLKQDLKETGETVHKILERLNNITENHAHDLKKIKQDYVATIDRLHQIGGSIDLLQEHIARTRQSQHSIVKKIDEMPRSIDIKLKQMQHPLLVEMSQMRTVGYERIIDSKKYGKVKQIIYKTEPSQEKSKRKFNMPGVNESKMAMKESQL